jgi:ribonuclease D
MVVCRWREETARDRNKPRSWIIDDQMCLQLAVQDPRTQNALADGVGLPSPVVRRHGDELLDLLAAYRAVSEADLPLKLPSPLDAAQRDQIKKLKAEVREIAITLSVAPEVLVYSKDYELLLREAKGDVFELPVHWLGWRKETIFVVLRQSLALASA